MRRRWWVAGLSCVAIVGVLVVLGAPDLLASGDPDEVDEVDRPAATSDAAAPVAQLSPSDRATVARVVRSLEGLPSGGEVTSVEPSFDDDGRLVGGVASVRFDAVTGTMRLPGDQMYRRGEQTERFVDHYEYRVDGVDSALVAVDFAGERVQWATPDTSVTGTVGAVERVATVDPSSGRTIDLDAEGWTAVRADEGE
jgi:hypothetical protein